MSNVEVLRNFGSYWMEVDAPGAESTGSAYYPSDGIGGVTTTGADSILAGSSVTTIIEAVTILESPATGPAPLSLIIFRDADVAIVFSLATGYGTGEKNKRMPLGNGYAMTTGTSGNFSVAVNNAATKIHVDFRVQY